MTVDTRAIEELLTQRLGLDARSVGKSAILDAVKIRAEAVGRDLAAYAKLAGSDGSELSALVEEVVVPESWFLRDQVPFTHLAGHARAVLRGRRGPFRVLSIPCSQGEEPYSIVLALLDAGIPAADIDVTGVDVSARLVERARRGVYRSPSFRGTDPELRRRHFREMPDARLGPTWALADGVRAAVTFRQGNILSPTFLAGEAPFDAIFCRNLFIYLTADARKRALTSLDRALAPDGLVVMGHAESLELVDPRFRSIAVAGSFTYRRRDPSQERDRGRHATPPFSPAPRMPTPAVSPALRVPTPAVSPAPRMPTPPTAPASRAAAVAPGPFAPAEPARDLVAEASELADRGELELAAAACEKHLETAGSDARGWTLLGTIRSARGELDRAETCFSRALYCDPGHRTAMLQLALLLDGRGDRAGAANLRRRAQRTTGGGLR